MKAFMLSDYRNLPSYYTAQAIDAAKTLKVSTNYWLKSKIIHEGSLKLMPQLCCPHTPD